MRKPISEETAWVRVTPLVQDNGDGTWSVQLQSMNRSEVYTASSKDEALKGLNAYQVEPCELRSEEMNGMKLHEQLYTKGAYEILRVPGGWIYTRFSEDGGTACCFVPCPK